MYHIFKDSTSETPQGYDVYKVLIESDEGRTYAKLSTDAERLEFMRLHAHEKIPTVYANVIGYDDLKEGKAYSINVKSPEAEKASELIGDSDDERDEEAEEKVRLYFKKHAHTVHDLDPKPEQPRAGDEDVKK